MRRLFVLLLVAACLLPDAAPVRAQATADQLNKLSLEALTTPAPGGNPGPSYHRRAAQRSFYRGLSRGGRSYSRRSYSGRSYSGRSYSGRAYARRSGGYRAARRSYGQRSYRRYDAYRATASRSPRPRSRYAAAQHYRRRYR